MKAENKEKLKVILIIQLIIIAFIEGLIIGMPKIKSYFERKEIEEKNTETIDLISEKDIIAREKKVSRGEELEVTEKLPKELPEQAYLQVGFICQAPLETVENWTSHENSCEEAALLMAYLYETGQTITKEDANTTILDMIDWQVKSFGNHHDIYAEELKKFAIEYYGIDPEEIEIIKNASLEDIKKQINSGHPVIVPITGEILKNPYYPYPGYHMLTVIGYTKDRIITNDNGTRHGADFSYDNAIFEEAMNDAGGDIVILKL